jgi:hypothetical protein
MNLVIDLLSKELERQNLLIMSNKIQKQARANVPDLKSDGPLIEHVYPNMVQLRDQIEDAIAYLKTKSPGL